MVCGMTKVLKTLIIKARFTKCVIELFYYHNKKKPRKGKNL